MAIMAFRESGKSTIMNLTNVLWSILGKPSKKFVIIISKTQEQAKNHFLNIKAELEKNELLKEDFGPFTENEDDMKRLSLEIEYHGAKIIAITREQSIRGLKFGVHRPDLIICDDLEDITSVLDQKESEAFYNRFQNEIIPAGSTDTRIVILGNLLSENSFMMKLKDDISEKKVPGIFRAYPLLDDYGRNLWTDKFSESHSVKEVKSKLSEEAWTREYLLSFNEEEYYPESDIPDLRLDETDDDVISKWFHFKLANLRNQYRDKLAYTKPQKFLIFQMKQYTISAPDTGSFIDPEKGELLYEKYQEYKKETEKITNEHHNVRRRAIHNRIDKLHLPDEEGLDPALLDWEDNEKDGNEVGSLQKLQNFKDNFIEEKFKGLSREKINRIKKVGYYDPNFDITEEDENEDD